MLKNHPDYFIINLDKLTYAGNLENLTGTSDHNNYIFIKGDIGDEDLVKKIFNGLKHPATKQTMKIDSVINFAAESHVDRSIQNVNDFLITNILGVKNLLEAAKISWHESNKYKDKMFIQISTDEVYGSLGKTGKFTEKSPYNPKNPYAASKAGADHLVSSFLNTYNLPVIITHCSNNYGPYQFPEKLIPLTITNAINQKPIPLYGNGENIRDWVFVTDHCRALATILKYGKSGHCYNIGGNNEKKNIEVVTKICEILDEMCPADFSHKELITFVKDRPGHDLRYAIDYNKIMHELGWVPQVSFDEGIKDTIQWFLKNRDWANRITSGEYMAYNNKYCRSRIY